MTSESHAGRVTLYKVPRRIVVGFFAALLLLVVYVLDSTQLLGASPDIASATAVVERVLAGFVAMASLLGWTGIAGWLKDPTRSTVD